MRNVQLEHYDNSTNFVLRRMQACVLIGPNRKTAGNWDCNEVETFIYHSNKIFMQEYQRTFQSFQKPLI